MISSIFHGLFICYSHSSLSKDQIVPKHFHDPWLYTNSSMDHKDSYLGNSGKASNPTNTPLPETPRYSAYPLTPQRQESMIQTAKLKLCFSTVCEQHTQGCVHGQNWRSCFMLGKKVLGVG